MTRLTVEKLKFIRYKFCYPRLFTFSNPNLNQKLKRLRVKIDEMISEEYNLQRFAK